MVNSHTRPSIYWNLIDQLSWKLISFLVTFLPFNSSIWIYFPSSFYVNVCLTLQVRDELPEHLFKEHDVPVDIIITPTQIIEVAEKLPRPTGIIWEILSNRRILEIPILQKLREKEQRYYFKVTFSTSRSRIFRTLFWCLVSVKHGPYWKMLFSPLLGLEELRLLCNEWTISKNGFLSSLPWPLTLFDRKICR